MKMTKANYDHRIESSRRSGNFVDVPGKEVGDYEVLIKLVHRDDSDILSMMNYGPVVGKFTLRNKITKDENNYEIIYGNSSHMHHLHALDNNHTTIISGDGYPPKELDSMINAMVDYQKQLGNT